MRVLLVEDEERLSGAIVAGLGAEGFTVDAVRTGTDGLARATEGEYVAIILDILLPDLDGYEVCAALREREIWTPILMLTAKDGEYDEAEALDTGADDFLSKPFSYIVLVARLRALARRGTAARPAVLCVGDLELDPGARRCRRAGSDITLTPREFALLGMLMRHAGQVLSKRRLLESVWGLDFSGDPNIVKSTWDTYEKRSICPSRGAASRRSAASATACVRKREMRAFFSSRLNALATRAGSLRVRLTLGVAVVSLLALSAGAFLLVWTVQATVLRGIHRSNTEELDSVRAQLERGVSPQALELPGGFLRVAPPPGIDNAPAGPGAPAPEFLPPPPPPEPPAPPGSAFGILGPPPGAGFGITTRSGWSISQHLAFPPHDGPFVVAVGRPLMEARRSFDTLASVLVAGVPLLVLLTTIAAWFLVGRTLRPVDAMSRSAARIANATSADRLSVPATNDEVAGLADTLNRMLDRIGDSTRRQREFVSDASHELRSPIAALRTLLEVGLAHPSSTDPRTLQAAALAETLRLEALAADLLTLARLDEAVPPKRDELDLDDLVLEEARRPRHVALETRAVIPTKLCGDRQGLTHLVRNLLDNAARYAATRVSVSTHAEPRGIVLWVDDDGPGIPEPERERVFERFTRAKADRSRETGGAGLGLAVVRRIAEQHGGTVRAFASPLGGARVEVVFPASAALTPG
jgi:DNA-binding response OmpR family regulator/signal transduction histidine kinase